eukprot:4165321-Amphidinium_carterae.1
MEASHFQRTHVGLNLSEVGVGLPPESDSSSGDQVKSEIAEVDVLVLGCIPDLRSVPLVWRERCLTSAGCPSTSSFGTWRCLHGWCSSRV